MLYGPSRVQNINYDQLETRSKGHTTHFHNLPATSSLIIYRLRYSIDSIEVGALLYFVFLADNDFVGLPVSEYQHLLRGACGN